MPAVVAVNGCVKEGTPGRTLSNKSLSSLKESIRAYETFAVILRVAALTIPTLTINMPKKRINVTILFILSPPFK